MRSQPSPRITTSTGNTATNRENEPSGAMITAIAVAEIQIMVRLAISHSPCVECRASRRIRNHVTAISIAVRTNMTPTTIRTAVPL